MRCLVTGAHGFIGRFVLDELRDSRVLVRATTRPGDATQAATYETIPLTIGPLTDWDGALKNVQAIVHLADGLRALEEKASAGEVNADILIESTIHLAQAALAAGVKRFVYLSSIKAVCDEISDELLSEDKTPNPTSLYGRAKLKTEIMLKRLIGGTGMQLIIIRNPIVYGAGASNNMGRLLALADTPFPLPLLGLNNRRSIIAGQNLASAITAVIKSEEAVSGTYFVHDDPPLSTAELIAMMRNVLNRPRRFFFVPDVFWKVGRSLPRAGHILRRLSGSLALDDEKFRQQFNWRQRVDTEEAIRQMVLAYKS